MRTGPDSSSFPSGHTTAAVAFVAAVAPVRPLAAAACAVPAALLAVDRVQSGAHYPTRCRRRCLDRAGRCLTYPAYPASAAALAVVATQRPAAHPLLTAECFPPELHGSGYSASHRRPGRPPWRGPKGRNDTEQEGIACRVHNRRARLHTTLGTSRWASWSSRPLSS
ncbi:hypothetical protein [Streptomyces rhizosphaerihabitans]|uniref:hypothetical protein n=1 Tax=Streptomyces rhizosphaerihabitans TaxID=1266770 RepID=UPI003704C43B